MNKLDKDAADLIALHDSPQTLFYVDPPYPHATRGFRRRNAAYAFELTDDDHEILAGVLHAVTGMVMLSSYPCELYDRLYAGWHQVQRSTHADGANVRVEVLWMNPACHAVQRQQRLIA